jgi:hypothetical protein
MVQDNTEEKKVVAAVLVIEKDNVGGQRRLLTRLMETMFMA